MKKEWVIEVWLKAHPDGIDRGYQYCGVGLLITEIFRYAGITRVLEDSEHWLKFQIRRAGARGTFEWADMNSKRIRSFVLSAQPVEVRL